MSIRILSAGENVTMYLARVSESIYSISISDLHESLYKFRIGDASPCQGHFASYRTRCCCPQNSSRRYGKCCCLLTNRGLPFDTPFLFTSLGSILPFSSRRRPKLLSPCLGRNVLRMFALDPAFAQGQDLLSQEFVLHDVDQLFPGFY